jgi:hypothetical protein
MHLTLQEKPFCTYSFKRSGSIAERGSLTNLEKTEETTMRRGAPQSMKRGTIA